MGASPDDAAIAVVIAAAGSSRRMGGGIKKEYRPLGEGIDDADGRPITVLGAAAGAFAANPRISAIVITVPFGVEYGQAAARAALPPSLFMPGNRPPSSLPRADPAAGLRSTTP